MVEFCRLKLFVLSRVAHVNNLPPHVSRKNIRWNIVERNAGSLSDAKRDIATNFVLM